MLWADPGEDCVGLYWSDGVEVLRVVTKDAVLWLFDEEEIAQVEADIPWVDHSDPKISCHYTGPGQRIEGSCGFTGGAALAVGAAASVAWECGGFVNPKPQTVVRSGVVTTTMPRRQISA